MLKTINNKIKNKISEINKWNKIRKKNYKRIYWLSNNDFIFNSFILLNEKFILCCSFTDYCLSINYSF
jgi:hypothetical protein